MVADAAVDVRPALRALRIEALGHVALGCALTAGLAHVAGRWLARPEAFLVQSAAVFALMALAAFLVLPRHLPLRRIGPANRVTLLRAVMVALLAGLLGQPLGLLAEPALGWAVFAWALAAVLLDAVDGWVARRRRCGSRFGASIDMELDALAVLVLALVAAGLGKAGPWIVAAGALRYLFLAGQLLWPRLDRPLPPSQRRRLVCALQTLALVACLAPAVQPPLSTLLAAASLALLAASFAIDVAWLLRRAGRKESNS